MCIQSDAGAIGQCLLWLMLNNFHVACITIVLLNAALPIFSCMYRSGINMRIVDCSRSVYASRQPADEQPHAAATCTCSVSNNSRSADRHHARLVQGRKEARGEARGEASIAVLLHWVRQLYIYAANHGFNNWLFSLATFPSAIIVYSILSTTVHYVCTCVETTSTLAD